MIEYLHLVRHCDRAKFEAAGWVFDDDLGADHGSSHSFYAVLMRWPFEGKPPAILEEERG